MEKIKPIIVLAGNRREFDHFAKGHKGYVFGSESYRLRGIEAQKIIVVGTFWDRTDSLQLYNIARATIR